MSAVRVKALDWAKHPRANMWRAVTIIGVYQVAAIIEPADWKFDGVDGGSRGEAENADAAKAAAQADYEARIMSALLPAQTEPDAGRVDGGGATPIAYVCEADIRLLASQPEGTDMSIAPKPYPEYGMKFALYAMPPSPPREEIEHQGVVAVGVKG